VWKDGIEMEGREVMVGSLSVRVRVYRTPGEGQECLETREGQETQETRESRGFCGSVALDREETFWSGYRGQREAERARCLTPKSEEGRGKASVRD